MSAKSYSARIASNPYIVGGFACIGGGLFGLDISSMSGVITNEHYLAQYNYPGPSAQGAIVASMPAGSLVGAFITAWLGDWLGRKRTVMLSGVFWVIGCTLQCASVDRGMLCAGRVIAGLSVGIASTVVPLYQAEITAPAIRGRLISLQQWSITWGILIQYFIQFGCSYINGKASFRLPWGLQMIPAILLSVGMMWFPESPRWLYDQDRPEEALEVLADLHGGGDQQNELVQLEYQEIAEQVNFERTQGSKSWMDLLQPGIFRRVHLGFFLQVWSQMSGMNVMMYYILYVFQGAGLKGTRAGLIAASVQYVLNMAFTVPAILWIDKWGRRPMLLAGFGGMCVFLCLVGGLQGGYGEQVGSLWLINNHKGATYAVIVCSYLCVCSFSPFVGPVSWTYPAEIFPMRVRSKAIAISTMGNWSFNTALAFFAPVALNSIAYRTYFLFAGFCAAAFVHVFFMFPETAGRTLEEVDEVFQHGHVFSAWALSDRNIGKKTLADVKKGPETHIDEKSDNGSEPRDV